MTLQAVTLGGPGMDLRSSGLGHGDLVPYAYLISSRAHAGQVDKSGAEYIAHPRRVAHRLGTRAAGDEYIAVAWLHDVVEQASVTLDDLFAVGFSTEVIDAVNALTRRPGERDPVDYYRRVVANKIALAVKLADIEDNRDPRRLRLLPVETAERLSRKYAHAVALLAELTSNPVLDQTDVG
ncbi:MAG: phosphohydrolase [Pseudonocardiales bacterium]|nr:phosphohydrolase [Pseudonocardiales bacterium]